jgi:hypothetical protein
MTDLQLPAEITVSALLGEDPDQAAGQLEHVMAVVKARYRVLADTGKREWAGEETAVVIVPSSAVLYDHRAGRLVEQLARTARKAGITVRLIDESREIHSSIEGGMVYPLSHFGNLTIRHFALDPEIQHVTFHALTPTELVQMTENFGCQTTDQ